MNPDKQGLRRRVLEAIRAVAPEIDVERMPAGRPLREQIDLDSMDWINILAKLEQRLEVEIPPSDQRRLSTVDDIVDYLASMPAGHAGTRAEAGAPLPCRTFFVQGLPVMVRPMCAEDMPLEDEFVRRLSRTSRYKRFMATLNELPPAKLWSLTHVDQVHDVALVAVVLVDDAPALAGVSRYAVDRAGTGCEFALAVDDAWQGSGLAGILMHLLIEVARSRGLARMEGLVLRSNERMLKLGLQLGFTREADPEDRDTVRIVRAL
jgi:acetyltransferase